MPATQNAPQIFDQVFLDVRARLIELAASLDRLERADEAERVQEDPRFRRILDSLEILKSGGFDRAERIQLVFSDEYSAGWNGDR